MYKKIDDDLRRVKGYNPKGRKVNDLLSQMSDTSKDRYLRKNPNAVDLYDKYKTEKDWHIEELNGPYKYDE